jgi:integrase
MRRERNIYKRKDGRYEARYIKGHDENGKAVYGAVYARTYAEVKEKRDQVKAADNDQLRKETPRTITDELEAYLSAIHTQVKPSTLAVYRRYLENHIAPYFMNTRCDQLTVELTQGFVDSQIENGLSAVTVQSVFSFLRNGLKGVFQNDALDVRLPKRIPNEVEVLSLEEQRRLETTLKLSDDINHIGVTLCLYTGLRIGELCGLKWMDIDFERRLLHVRRTLQRISNTDCASGTSEVSKTKVECLLPKSNASHRSIPLPGFLLSLLDKHHSNAQDNGFVISRDGSSIEPRNMQYRFEKLLTEADVKKVNFHVTRHTFATRALENGFDVKTLSEILGHSSATITLKKYAHTLDEHKRKSMEALASVYQ